LDEQVRLLSVLPCGSSEQQPLRRRENVITSGASMTDLATLLPARRPELVLRLLDDGGVVKDPRTGQYFQLQEQEYFLLLLLDTAQTTGALRAAFEERFGESLTEEDLDDFLKLLAEQGFLVTPGEQPGPAGGAAPRTSDPASPLPRQSILHWRKSFFDPDRLFTWLAPRLWFFWTRTFLLVSAGSILFACLLLWLERAQVVSTAANALRWETAVLVWLVLFVVTMLHEFAHGLTCKHHGGEVHEIGFLLLFFMPCFYCNVSDAWLFREKAKRLWVTFVGGYFELFLWSLAVFVWRLTLPNSLLNNLAFVVVSACGVRTLFNFNPLLKLDGYYLLSDWLELPNLRQRSLDHFNGQLRRLLWGAPRPAAEPRGRLLLGFGLISWLYSLTFLTLMLGALLLFLWRDWGWAGLVGVAVLGLVSTPGVLHGFTAGEVGKMITLRRKRTVLWVLILAGVAALLCLVQRQDRASGSFRLRPARRAELRARVAGFVKEVHVDEGVRVSPGALVARLEVPDLDSRLAQKQAEIRELQAKRRLLQIGARPEEIAEQRYRIERAEAWRDLGQQELKRSRLALVEDLDRADKQITACRAECDVAQASFQRARALAGRKALAQEEYQEVAGRFRVSRARLAEAQAARRALQARGVAAAEAEAARREKELAEARAALRLLLAGTRPEERQAVQSHLERLQEELAHLQRQRHRQTITAPLGGLVTTAHLKEKVGQFLREGDLLCVVEESAELEAEVSLAEQDVARVRIGQTVELKARALPFATIVTQVERIAPAAGRGDVQSSVIIYCRLDHSAAELRPEMTGHARVYTGARPVGAILLNRALRFLRTEFWW
jgi:multidrug resistance efflux pump